MINIYIISLGTMTYYLSVNNLFLVASAPNNSTETRYNIVVKRVANNVPIGIERWVSFSEADLLEPAIIPVTAGKKRPTNALQEKDKSRKLIHKNFLGNK